MDAITANDVRMAFKRFATTCQDYGLIESGHKLILTMGSKTYGNAFRVNSVWIDQDKGTGHYRPQVGDDFLGMTRREAYNELVARNSVLWDLIRFDKLVKDEG